MMSESDTVRVDALGQDLKYANQVRIIGIIELVIQVILVIVCVGIGFVLILGPTMLVANNQNEFRNLNDIETWHSSNYGQSFNQSQPEKISATIIIMVIVILILTVVFNGWVVSLVYIGGQKRDAGRLTTWYMLQFVFFVISILGLFFNIFSYRSPAWQIILDIAVLSYRLYSIHVVRRHAKEIEAETHIQVYLPNRI